MIWIVSSILFIFTLVGAVIAASTLNDYKTAQGRQLAGVLFSSSAASFAYGMEILTPGLYEKFFWVLVRYFGLITFSLASALFVFYFTHAPLRFKSWGFLGLCLPLAIILFLHATYPLTHLVYDQIWLDTSGPFPMIAKTVGPVYWVLNIYVMVLLAVLIYLVINNLPRGSNLNRRQSWVIAAALTLVFTTHLLYLGGIRLDGVLNPNLFSYFPAAALILWGTKRYRLADIRPVARTLLLEQMQDGILVIDQPGNLIDINPAAEKYLNISQKQGTGKPLKNVSVEIAGILLDLDGRKKVASLIELNGIPLQVTINPLVIPHGQDGGYLIILRDISDRVEAEQLKEKEIKRQTGWVERQKIARTLHDSISQYLRSLVLLSTSAKTRLNQARYDELDPVIDHISAGSSQAAKEMDVLIQELQLESPSDQGFELVQALRERVDIISSQFKLAIQLESPDMLHLNSSQQREIFYILLEALNNILQHANAETVLINLQQSGSLFTLEISDNGCGFDPDQPRTEGMGLANMTERARQLGAQLTLESIPGAGTRLRLDLPGLPA
jgi:PAS domain S-box-containing protein